jgi:hypothetical protein
MKEPPRHVVLVWVLLFIVSSVIMIFVLREIGRVIARTVT